MLQGEVPDKTIRVLHVTFNMAFGGTEAVIRELTAWNEEGRVTHEVVCIDGTVGAIGEQLRQRGIPVQTLQRRPGFDTKLIGSLRRLIRSHKVDIVHCHQYTPWVYGCLGGLGTSAKVLFTEHGRFHPDRYRYKAFLVNRLLASRTSRIVAISGATKEALAQYEFLPHRRIEVVYNGIKALQVEKSAVERLRNDLGLSPGLFVMGTVARLDPVKNQAMMLKSFATINRQYPKTRLLIVGDGPERGALEKQAAVLGMSQQVIFTGFATEPAPYLALMNLFLLSSDTEGTSMTLLEAMSLGLPVVATEAGGTPEIVEHGVTGLLTPVGDEGAFSLAIKDVLMNEHKAREMGASGLASFQARYSVGSMARQYADLYDSAMGYSVPSRKGLDV